MTPGSPRAWLFKSEPGEFSFDDLWAAKGRRTSWNGIRNYQARNLLRDEVRKGDRVLFYHSSADPTGVAGLAQVTKAPYPDPTQFDPRDPGHDPASTRDDPRWWSVEIRAVEKLARVVTLDELKATRELSSMGVVRRGNRLSVQPVSDAELATVLRLAAAPLESDNPAPSPSKRAR
jgi:predicted RNA-binding protein with PUA-like domain